MPFTDGILVQLVNLVESIPRREHTLDLLDHVPEKTV